MAANRDAMDWRSRCPISSALDVLGDKWSLLIIRDLMHHETRTYSAFLEKPERISTNILAARLALLTDLKLREYLTPKEGTPEQKEWRSASPDPFNYVDQMFKQARPGAESSPAPTVDTPIPPGPTAPAPKGG